MVLLTRVVRFAVNDAPGAGEQSRNGYAGRPGLAGLGRHYELEVSCRGEVDPVKGYLIDIQAIDRGVRGEVVPAITRAARERPGADPAAVLSDSVRGLERALGMPVARARWRLSPYCSVEVGGDLMARGASGTTAVLRQKFDFAAAHRLHVESLSAEENRRLFGKCNFAGGHGHNYQFEVCVEVGVEVGAGVGGGSRAFSPSALETLAFERVIDRFDHKNLNDDEAFKPPAGVNPSVENIAKVIHDLLADGVAREGGRLREVTVWESDRTSSTYPG